MDNPRNAPSTARLETAFEALKAYAAGSNRAGLIPIDEEVTAALADPSAIRPLQQKLLALLQGNPSPEAAEYIISKLALIGTDSAAGALAAVMVDPRLSTAARNALEKINPATAHKKLRAACGAPNGVLRIGAVQSLGHLRDATAVPLLRNLLRDSDPAVAGAALHALGEIGSAKSAATLKAFAAQAPAGLRLQAIDAALTCAERLLLAGQKSAAKTLCASLASLPMPAHARQATEAALRKANS